MPPPCTLCTLPNEMLLSCFQQLADFDDARALAQSWRRARAVYQRHEDSILGAIVLRSDTYQHDLSLCLVMEANRTPSGPRDRTSPPASKRARRETSTLRRCLSIDRTDLTGPRLQTIRSRWQLVRRLQTIYLDPLIQSEYRRYPAWSGTLQIDELLSIFAGSEPVQDADEDGSAGIRAAGPPLPEPLRFDGPQRQRFYKAVTAYWLAVDARQLVSVVASTPLSMPTTPQVATATAAGMPPSAADLVLLNRLWLGGERTILENMDILEVYDFLYGFLSAISGSHPDDHLIRPPLASPWPGRRGPATGALAIAHADRIPITWTRDALTRFCRLHLRPLTPARFVVYQPPHPHHHRHRRDPRHAPRHHHDLAPPGPASIDGHRADLGATVDVHRMGSTHLTDAGRYPYPVRCLELAVEMALFRARLFGPDPNAAANVWTCYRKHWNRHARGTLFWSATASAHVIRDIQRYATDAECLTRHPFFVRLSRCD